MREIKFRAWDYIEKEMNYDLNTILFEKTKRNQFSVNVNKFNGTRTLIVCDYFLDENDNEIKRDSVDAVLMQYTGLKDVNGKEIYEGDVMPVNGENCYVVYSEEYARYCLQMKSGRMFIPSKNGEIIGNVYENPECLGGVGE